MIRFTIDERSLIRIVREEGEWYMKDPGTDKLRFSNFLVDKFGVQFIDYGWYEVKEGSYSQCFAYAATPKLICKIKLIYGDCIVVHRNDYELLEF